MDDLTPLVLWFVRRCRRHAPGVDPADLRQTVWGAVLEAKKRHDPAKGTLSTIAAWYVRWRVRDLVRDTAFRGLHVPAKHHGGGDLFRGMPADVPGPDRPPDVPELWPLAERVLDPRAYRVLRLRLVDGLTLDQAGRAVGGLTRERVRQIEAGAMAKLRAAV